MSPIINKWAAFGWETYTVNGHEIADIHKIFNSLDYANKKPKVIIADTVKGKGVSFMENNPDFHGKTANEDQLKEAIKEINSN